jgi:hypothetical protein
MRTGRKMMEELRKIHQAFGGGEPPVTWGEFAEMCSNVGLTHVVVEEHVVVKCAPRQPGERQIEYEWRLDNAFYNGNRECVRGVKLGGVIHPEEEMVGTGEMNSLAWYENHGEDPLGFLHL